MLTKVANSDCPQDLLSKNTLVFFIAGAHLGAYAIQVK